MAPSSVGPEFLKPPPAHPAGRSRSNSASSAPSHVSTASKTDTKPVLAGYGIPSEDEVLLHYRLLAAFEKLRRQVSSTPGLFGLNDPVPGTDPREVDRVAGKRWQVYITRAVERFTVWWEKVLPKTAGGVPMDDLSKQNLESRAQMWREFQSGRSPWEAAGFGVEHLPPLDVIMIWHAYVLNAQYFLEDCLQAGRMDLWLTGLPLGAICSRVDDESGFKMDPVAGVVWSEATGLPVDNLDMPDRKDVICPVCGTATATPWTVVQKTTEPAALFPPPSKSTGWADYGFELRCSKKECQNILTYESLSSGRFLSALRHAKATGILLPVSFFNKRGIFETHVHDYGSSPKLWPHELFSQLLPRLEEAMNTQPFVGMEDIWKFTVFNARKTDVGKPKPERRFSLEQMMTHFHLNPSPFRVDLVSAVTCQGVFNRQVVSLDWSVTNTANPQRLGTALRKYQRFFTMWRRYTWSPLAPTLDVDLVWSTHLLRPQDYWRYTMGTAKQFVDHGSRRCEWELKRMFVWTCRAYNREFKEPFTRCGCWYCECIRATFLPSFSTLVARRSALHTLIPPLLDPATHVSAHNAVSLGGTSCAVSEQQFKGLLLHHRVAAQVRKKFRTPRAVEVGGDPTDLASATRSCADAVHVANFAIDPTTIQRWSTLELLRKDKNGVKAETWASAMENVRDSTFWGADGHGAGGNGGCGGGDGGGGGGGCGGG